MNFRRSIYTTLLMVLLIVALILVYCYYIAKPKPAAYALLDTKITQSDNDHRIYRYAKLNNGMQVLLVSDRHAPKSLAAIGVKVGSLQDPKTQQGLAHYTEHMLLMGSKQFPQPDEFATYLSQHGGSYNASTTNTRTSFYFEVENEAIKPALERLADAIAEPLFDVNYADKERNAVNAELTMARSSEGFRIEQVNAETMNQQHPASQFTGGNLQTLSDKPDSKLHDELLKFYQHYYSANQMVAVIYSNLSIEKLAHLAAQTFGQVKNKQLTPPQVTQPAFTDQQLGKWINLQPAQPRKVLMLQFPIANQPQKYREKITAYISYLLTNQTAGTLSKQLQDAGLIDGLGASASEDSYGNSGEFRITVSLTDQGLEQRNQIIAAIFSYLQLIQQQGVTENYFHELQRVLEADFRFPEINRDMSYAEYLTDQMLHYPPQDVLSGPYRTDHFVAEDIQAMLQQLTVDKVRIWLIAPDVPTDRKAYFLDAPYQINDITGEQKRHWLQMAAQQHFALPKPNPYLPSDFSLVKKQAESTNYVFSTEGNMVYLPTNYFKTSPKSYLLLSVRNLQLVDDAKQQVVASLYDYLLNRDTTTLQQQAGLGSLLVDTGIKNGVEISVSGFSQHAASVLQSMWQHYLQLQIDPQVLQLAKTWYLQQLDQAESERSFSLSLQPIRALNSYHYTERQQRRELVPQITVADLQAYQQQLHQGVPYLLSMGNLTQAQAKNLYYQIQQTLQTDNRYLPPKQLQVMHPLTAALTIPAASSDSALTLQLVPLHYSELESRARSMLLTRIISAWFYQQLRSEEQLGYAVFCLPSALGKNYGYVLTIQSNQYSPAYLYQRYQEFLPKAVEKLKAMSDDEFKQYRDAVLAQLKQAPQTLPDEAARYLDDFQRGRFDFTQRAQLMEHLQALTKDHLLAYLQNSLDPQQSVQLLYQVQGKLGNKPAELVTAVPQVKSVTELLQKLQAKP